MLSTKTIFCAAALTALVPLSTACVAKNEAQLAADTTGAEDVNGTESDVESLGASFVSSDGQSLATQSLLGGGIQVQGVTTGVAAFAFIPSGCLTVDDDTASSKVTYTFNACTGPLGLVELNGTVAASYQLAGGQLTVNFAAQNFQINRATITSWEATAVVSTSGDQRTMTWDAQLSGTTGEGRTFTRTNQKTITWTEGVACIAASGQSTGDILGDTLQTTVVSWQRCADSCPQAGSEISVQDLTKGDSLDIKYNGGPTADLTADGRSIEIRLACGDY